MTLTGSDAIEGLFHLTKYVQDSPDHIVLYSNGKRYAGFRDANHAAFVIKHLSLSNVEIRIEAKPVRVTKPSPPP